MRLTPEQEAAYALDYGMSRAGLKPQVQTAYDRLLKERQAAADRPAAAAPASSPPQATWQGSPPAPRYSWPRWVLIGAAFAFVTAFIVGGFGGNDGGDAANQAAASLFLLSLAAVCVAVPAALYFRHRSKRMAAQPQPEPGPYSSCYRCGYPLAVHSGDDLICPKAGICHRCGHPIAVHVGYELTCPSPSDAPHCHRCGQPFTAHVGHEMTCPMPSSP